MLNRIITTFFFLSSSFFLLSKAQAPRSYTSSEVLLQLKKLNTVGSVLYIAAHPDDENTRLIAYLANEKCLRTGYLSLTRGDGGQNLIGPEQGIELGVIRTQELLAARRIDGGEQFFTRAYDFGYSKSPDETLKKWNKDSILSDMVWVIRNFRPDIIITRFATDGSGGHGHHTTSAILAEEAFDAAADPTKFPEQLKYVEAWKTRRLFYNSAARFFNPNADMSKLLKLDVGVYNPLLGKSYGEIAAESRSMHKSQGFGSARQRGEQLEYFKPIKGDTAGLKDIFDGIDFTWNRVKGSEKVGKMITETIKNYKIEHPELSLPAFSKIGTELSVLRNNTSLAHKVMLANSIVLNMHGIVVDATSSEANITLGSKQKLAVSVIARNTDANQLYKLQMAGNLMNDFLSFDTTINKTLRKNELGIYSFQSLYGKSDQISQPHHLKHPIQNSMFVIDDMFNRSAPEVSLNSSGHAAIEGQNVFYTFQYRWVDPEKGEQYRPLVITPPVMINLAENIAVFGSDQEKEFKIKLKAGRDSVAGRFEIGLPKDWTISCIGDGSEELFLATRSAAAGKSYTSCEFKLNKKGSESSYSIKIKPSGLSRDTTIKLSVIVDGIEYTKGIKEIKYDHIPVQTLFPEAEIKLVKLDVKTKSKRIGYIPGAGDEVAPSLTQLGYEVITLTDDMLAKESLSIYDAILTGVRAYNTNEKLASFKPKLMEYVSNGGNLIVQYNTNSFAGPFKSDIGPYPFKITRDRITDEEAKIVMELPNHPVFNTPNKITDKDFEGWIQERSIYHGGDWDSNYVAPISMADPNEKANKGALLIAKHGKGNFIYTGLVFFRELPAGVPGAYRLMVNLIELGK
ncbi:MAG: PIG-L family deacetylase [Bacteroidota bacterium]